MSGAKLISPLLDRFAIGDAISEHNGVRCYPAMREDSDEKYIVKVVSIPASQVQLDALLLTGAYRDKASALAYFRELADSVEQEAEVLQKLSKLEGFISYDAWQVVPMDDGVGFEVYLLGTYKRSLERYMSRNPMTHLGAINLGLDLCSALAVCRRAGCLYVDLKPSNIFISENQSYHIGDLGIVPTSSLRFASLPDRYRSSYTAPEIEDAFSSLNESMDIYALGLILYQAYNNGELPFEGNAPKEVLPAPMYADYEMSEIILKACAPNPEDRWQDPSQMGQALVGYMQRNGATDMPIIPPVSVPEDLPEDFLDEEINDFISEEENSQDSILDDQIALDEFRDIEPADEEEPFVEVNFQDEAEEASASEREADESDQEDAADLSFIDAMVSDETAPDLDTALNLTDTELTDELSEILAQADDLISHETPEGVIPPEPVEIPMPEPIILPDDEPEETAETEEEPENDEPEQASEEESEGITLQLPEENTETDEEFEATQPRKRGKGWIAAIIILLLLAAIGFGCAYFYQNYFLQTVSNLTLDGSRDQLTVTLDTAIPDENLVVTCTDTYGISTKVAVHDGVATFSGLNPATTYTITVEMDGFHQLAGETSATYTTDTKTNIVSFVAVTGPSDGSVILNFTVNGPEADEWSVSCTADGEKETVATFTGHTTTVTDLAVGKEYTFTLIPNGDMYLDGTYSITHQVSKVLYPENLRFESLEDDILTLAWNNPEGHDSLKWSLTHYNSAGEIISMAAITEESARLELGDLTQSNTFELLAEGMTQSSKITLSANPVTILRLNADDSDYPKMNLQWEFEGAAPESGWSIIVTADGSEPLDVVTSDTNSVQLDYLIPGAQYELTFQTGDNTTVFNPTLTFKAPDANIFDDFWINTSNIEVSMCKTPDVEGWTHDDLTEEDYTNQFHSGDKASFVLHLNRSHADSLDDVMTTVVIRNASGVPVMAYSTTQSWYSMWNQRYCTMEIDQLPEESGSYLAEIYFNGNVAGSREFTVE